ncbi:hypothetical protein IPF37_03090 [bacterium]|nr:MAG: hypothetical protein IPF37_03090 [bacterium]
MKIFNLRFNNFAAKNKFIFLFVFFLSPAITMAGAVSRPKTSPASKIVASAGADWTILIYAQANNSLSKFAHRNFADMATVGSSKNLNILVQWYQPGQQGIWRYQINKERMDLDEYKPEPTDGNKAQDLVDSMEWAVSKYPAKKYALILWNHGMGVIDPLWGKSLQMIQPKMMKNNPRIQIEGLTQAAPQEKKKASVEQKDHRGILFNENSRTYMTNQVLAQALNEIKTRVLNDRKIDLFGMDACLMSMIEVGYQVRNYASYMVSSQEVELASGWAYQPLLHKLTNNTLTPAQLAQEIVINYQNLYKNKIQFYTQSAINLEKIDLLKDSIDTVVHDITICKDLDPIKFIDVIKKARSNCIQFSTQSYIDLHSFFSELSKQITSTYANRAQSKRLHPLTEANRKLQESISLSMKILADIVIANTSGRYLANVKGLSIYYPQTDIDTSYPKTEFAQDSTWHLFLQQILALQ